MFDTPFIIPVVAIICWAVVAIVRAKHGLNEDGNSDWTGDNSSTPPMFKKILEKEMSERDDEINILKERVQVLERIVTETHKSHSLSEEIDKLRDRT